MYISNSRQKREREKRNLRCFAGTGLYQCVSFIKLVLFLFIKNHPPLALALPIIQRKGGLEVCMCVCGGGWWGGLRWGKCSGVVPGNSFGGVAANQKGIKESYHLSSTVYPENRRKKKEKERKTDREKEKERKKERKRKKKREKKRKKYLEPGIVLCQSVSFTKLAHLLS